MKDTCTNHFVLFISVDSGETHAKTRTFWEQGKAQSYALQYDVHAIKFIIKMIYLKARGARFFPNFRGKYLINDG